MSAVLRRHVRTSSAALAVGILCTALLPSLEPLPATASPKAPATTGDTQHVIVMLRNQHTSTPASRVGISRRTQLTSADQRPLVDQVRAHHGTGIRQLRVMNAFAASMPASEATRLATDPRVAAVYPDRPVRLPAAQTSDRASAVPGRVSSKVCPSDPARPLLEPEALQLTHTAYRSASTPSAQRLATGRGVRVAFLADGLDVDNPDFIRADGSHVFADYRDFSGDGPLAPTSAAEAFGDASSIAAQGRQIYDLADYVTPAHPLPKGCTIRIRGMAPDVSLIGLKVFPAGGFAFNSAILAALDYAVSVDKVDVVNESFGSNQYPDTNDDPTAVFNELLVAAGVTVVSSSGDAGGENTIGSPASTPGVIAVGGTESLRSYAQTTESAFQLSNGRYRSNNISGLSSSGITQPGRTIDLVAPGDLGWAVCTANPEVWLDCADNKGDPSPLIEFGGTSQSSPFVAGAAALVIQAYRDTHRQNSPSPALVKRLLTGTATDLGLSGTVQGAGLLDSLKAVKAARSVGTARPTGSALITSPTQLNLESVSGRAVTTKVTVRNVGSRAAVITPRLRGERVIRSDDFSPTLAAQTDQRFVDSFGVNRAYVKQSFTVPAGTTHLTAAIAWPNPAALVRLTLLEPDGTYAAFSQPQGLGTFGQAEVTRPRAGRWTAVLWTGASAAGFTGSLQLTTTSFRSVTLGRVRPARISIPAGGSRTLAVRVPAGDAGDTAGALQLGPVSARLGGAIPVVTRTLVSTGRSGGTFSGSFSGGNGRTGIPAPSRTYDFAVPKGAKDLAVSVSVRGNPSQALYGFLIDPNGEPVSEKTNQIPAGDGSVDLSASLQFLHRAPQAGRWRLVFAVFGPVSGASTSTAYTGQVAYGLGRASSTGVPNSVTTTLPQGKTATATVSVSNRGAAAENYFVDARAARRTDVLLAGQHTSGYTLDPAPVAPFPAFVVPTGTNAFRVAARSDRPVNFEVSPFPADHVTDLAFEGDPDRIAAPAGLRPSVTVADPIVAAQTWLALPSQIGPFDDQAPAASVDFTAVAHTFAFDSAVVASTGNPQLAAVRQPAPAVSPLRLTPGQSGSISVSITPQAPVGSVVRGVLYVDSFDSVTGSSDEQVAIPYSYTVGQPSN